MQINWVNIIDHIIAAFLANLENIQKFYPLKRVIVNDYDFSIRFYTYPL